MQKNIFILIGIFLTPLLFCMENTFEVSYVSYRLENVFIKEKKADNFITKSNYIYNYLKLNEYITDMKKYEFKQTKENLFRRAEILFFGSLTIVSFAGWMSFSIYNVVMYGDTFGNLRREQFLVLYLGSAVISFSVSISDLFIQLSPKINKNIQIY
ncbi:MAG: hypothetical protein A2Y34_09445 [Spirochaetes bacterium GWC1_27_15]|nr:MAG: hypothetical protein A2Y34_09445 [Spirochaetes bacterium GWC1_27_15]